MSPSPPTGRRDRHGEVARRGATRNGPVIHSRAGVRSDTGAHDGQGAPMSAAAELRRAVTERHGVADVHLAVTHGVAKHEFYRDTAGTGWSAPLPGVRVRKGVPRSVKRDLATVAAASTHLVAASELTAAWLLGARQRPPRPATFVIAYGTDVPNLRGTRGRRARWLLPSDVEVRDGVPTLVGPAVAVSASRLRAEQLRALLIDLGFNGTCTPEEVLDRLDTVGPVPGRGTLRRECERLVGRTVESIFQEDVLEALTELGYRPERSTFRIETSDGVGLTSDVALKDWKVSLEPEGDAFHSSREQRRLDRRRMAAYAGTEWAPVPIDWRDWRDDRGHVLDAIDAAIESQRRRGIGQDVPPPRR